MAKRTKFSVRQKLNKYSADLKSGKRTKANAYRKGYVTALKEVSAQYDITKR